MFHRSLRSWKLLLYHPNRLIITLTKSGREWRKEKTMEMQELYPRWRRASLRWSAGWIVQRMAKKQEEQVSAGQGGCAKADAAAGRVLLFR